MLSPYGQIHKKQHSQNEKNRCCCCNHPQRRTREPHGEEADRPAAGEVLQLIALAS